MAKQLIKRANNLAQINKQSHKITTTIKTTITITITNARAAVDDGIKLKRHNKKKKPQERQQQQQR